MGMSPRQVDELTTWEFHTCLSAWQKANGAKDTPPPMSDDDLAAHGIEGFVQ